MLSAGLELKSLWEMSAPSSSNEQGRVLISGLWFPIAILCCVTQGLDGARRSVIGDSPQLLTHYYDDARTMYEVFRRGFSISGESTVMG